MFAFRHVPAPLKLIWRFGRMAVLACAAAYVLVVIGSAFKFNSFNFDLVTYTLRTAKAEVFDTLSVVAYKTTGSVIGVGSRPTRYALICQEAGKDTEDENAASERVVRRQLVDDKSGTAYNAMRTAFARGEEHPVFVLSKSADGRAKFCAFRYDLLQKCDCSGLYNATERSRIPASDLFGRQKPLS
jgi:hypothetical protein